MFVRHAWTVLAAMSVAGCAARELDIGSSDDGGVANATATSGSMASPSASGSGGTGGSSSGGGPAVMADSGGAATEGGAAPSLVSISTCDGDPLGASATLGVGFAAVAPTDCNGVGPALADMSATDLTSFLVGDWFACSGQLFGIENDIDNVQGIEFTADGQYHVLVASPDGSLVRVDALLSSDGGLGIAPDSGEPYDSGSAPAGAGTYDVIDGSATFGPGTYELVLHPTEGGVLLGQLTANDLPRQFQYLGANAGSQVFAPPAPWSPRVGVCACIDTQGTMLSEDPASLTAAMVGQWLWCANEPLSGGSVPPPNTLASNGPFNGPRMGIEFSAAGTWAELVESSAGSLFLGGGGTYAFTTGLPPELMGLLPGPLYLELYGSDGNQSAQYAQVVVTQNPRVLFLTTTTPGDGLLTNSIFFHLPSDDMALSAGAAFSSSDAGASPPDGSAPSPIDGVWTGYVESYTFPSGSDAITMTLALSGTTVTGTVVFGNAAPLPPVTDPNVGYPPYLDDAGPAGLPGLLSTASTGLEGFPYTIEMGTFDGARLQLGISAVELWKVWCGLQTSFQQGDAGVYGCLPTSGFVSGSPCQTLEPTTQTLVPVACGKAELCIAPHLCQCDPTGCTVDMSAPSVTFDMQVAGSTADGSTAGGLGNHNVHFVHGT